MPGVFNARWHLKPLAHLIRRHLPGVDVEIRSWGTPFRPLKNLSAERRNVRIAGDIAHALTGWRLERPTELLEVVGFSGGGGLATLVASALPVSVSIDRLILVAPAIGPGYPVIEAVVPHVREFVAVFASRADCQVGWGTRVFGTIDRKRTPSAGAVGFDAVHPKVLQWQWSPAALRQGHFGNHLSYLRPRWQRATLWPAIDPAVDAKALTARWLAEPTEPSVRGGLKS